MKFDRWTIVELCASVLTLAGIYTGSTTTLGAWFYFASLFFWYAIMVAKKTWGLLPLNLATTVVTIINLWKA